MCRAYWVWPAEGVRELPGFRQTQERAEPQAGRRGSGRTGRIHRQEEDGKSLFPEESGPGAQEEGQMKLASDILVALAFAAVLAGLFLRAVALAGCKPLVAAQAGSGSQPAVLVQ